MLAGALLLGRALWRSTDELSHLSWNPSVLGTLGSLGSLVLCLAWAPLMWQRLLRDFHHRVSYRDAFAIFYVTALAKYVPGSVFAYVGMIHYARRRHLSAGTTVFCTLVQQAVVCGGSVLVFGASLLLWPDHGWTYPLAAAAAWVAGGAVLLSPIPKRLLGLIAARILRQHVLPRFTRTAMIVSLGYFLVSWVFFAFGYYWLLQAFHRTSVRDTLIFTGIYAISWLVGFVAFVSPSGLGVRDGVQAYLLSFFVPYPVAITIALVQRLWLTAGDLLTGTAAMWLLRRTS